MSRFSDYTLGHGKIRYFSFLGLGIMMIYYVSIENIFKAGNPVYEWLWCLRISGRGTIEGQSKRVCVGLPLGVVGEGPVVHPAMPVI